MLTPDVSKGRNRQSSRGIDQVQLCENKVRAPELIKRKKKKKKSHKGGQDRSKTSSKRRRNNVEAPKEEVQSVKVGTVSTDLSVASDVCALSPEDLNVADTPQEVSEVTQRSTIEASVPEDPNVNMDDQTASPQPEDEKREFTRVHHTEERCVYDKLLASYKEENHGQLPSKRKTTMGKTTICKPLVPSPSDDKVRYIICLNICFSIYDS